jgi:hypothetical protein
MHIILTSSIQNDKNNKEKWKIIIIINVEPMTNLKLGSSTLTRTKNKKT